MLPTPATSSWSSSTVLIAVLRERVSSNSKVPVRGQRIGAELVEAWIARTARQPTHLAELAHVAEQHVFVGIGEAEREVRVDVGCEGILGFWCECASARRRQQTHAASRSREQLTGHAEMQKQSRLRRRARRSGTCRGV